MSDATKILNELKTAFAAKSPDLKKCQALVDSFKVCMRARCCREARV